MPDCVFCGIVAGDIPSDILYQDASVIAFKDINPMSPVHALIVPREHIAGLNDTADTGLLGHMAGVALELARKQNIAASGYRLVINCGPDGGQVVPHLHLHLLGGRKLSGKLG